MRAWMIVALACFVGACQQAGNQGVSATQSSRAAGSDSERHYFDPEIDALMSEIGRNLARACFPHAQDEQAFEECIRDQFSAAFDDSGQGRTSCDFHAALGDFLGCVTVGNSLIDLRHRLADDSPVPAGFWSGDKAMSDALTRTIIRRGTDACAASFEGAQLTDCLNDWFERRLALPTSLTDRCNANASGDDRQRCMGEAFLLHFLQDHVPRLGATST